MGLWRCQNPECSEDAAGRLIFDFEADLPICPKCAADSRKPEFRHTIVKREVVHLHVRDKKGPDVGVGSRYRIACVAATEGRKASVAGKFGSGDATAATCPACKKTPEYFAMIPAECRALAKEDYEVEIDALAGKMSIKEK